MRLYKDGEQDAIHKIFSSGGTLYFIEKPGTGKFHYIPLVNLMTPTVSGWPRGLRTDKVDWHTLTGAYLTREDAMKIADKLTEGGCDCCGHGSVLVDTVVTEHEFVNTPKK